MEYLREKGPKTVHNMDTLLLRESMDVIGEGLCRQSHLTSFIESEADQCTETNPGMEDKAVQHAGINVTPVPESA